MHVRLLALASLLAGSACIFDGSGVSGGSADDGGSGGDGNGGADGSDTGPPARCAAWDPAPAFFDPCDLADEPDSSLSLTEPGTYTFDTDSSVLDPPGEDNDVSLPTYTLSQSSVDVTALFVESFTLGQDAVLVVEGSSALLLAATGDIQIEGEIDASARSGDDDEEDSARPGPGGNAADCPSKADLQGGQAEPNDKGSAGGAGGSLLADNPGGVGASGANDGGNPPGGSVQAALSSEPTEIRGGCPGGHGGEGVDGDDLGRGGDGGGAVLLSADGEVTVSGTIHAGGSGGESGEEYGGGAGGGSGGFIGLEGDLVTVSGVVLADGGGGAGGAAHDTEGDPGQDARDTVTEVASGGAGNDGHAGDGGDGAFCATGAESGSPNQDSGGGGGGGGGFVFVLSHQPLVTGGSTIMPPDHCP